ncbi:adenylate/guanylate cyclase domain-containing protein [bacterium]|nr:adenylate/guanylate cyclase domain-containing protein [bacterium]
MKKFKPLIIFISVVLFMFITYFIFNFFVEPKFYNVMMNMVVANKSGHDDIVVIVIDDKSISKQRWPWKRDMYAKMFNYLDKYTNAKIIGFDSILTSVDKDNIKADIELYNSVKSNDKLVVGFVPLRKSYNDAQQGENYDKAFDEKFGIKIKDERTNKYKSPYRSLSMFPKGYFDSAKKVGSVYVERDGDGYLRTIPQLIPYKGKLYPSLGLKMYAELNDITEFTLTNNYLTNDKTDLKIPLNQSPSIIFDYMHFYKTRPQSEYSHKTYSAIDIVDSWNNLQNGKSPIINPKEFDGKIVFVGANAKAAALGLEDALPTPIHPKHPGVDIQATNLDNLLHGEFIVPTPALQDLIIQIVLILATFLIVTYYSLFMSLGIIALIMIAYIAVCVTFFKFNMAINVVTPLALQLITMIFGYSYKFILESRNKDKIKDAMGRYISQDVMKNVVSNIDNLSLGGKRSNVTVLFADIRGFTSMSEKLTPEEISLILNEYFTEIEPIITKYNGVINKFIGDAVMAIFGEPIQDKNHALNAVLCGNAMLKKVKQLQEKWLYEGKPKIEIGVGINTGDAFVGNIGSEKRLEYTVIGDTVNLASRLESYNKIYKTNFLISSSTYNEVKGNVDVIKISEVQIRGKAKKMDIYEILRVSNNNEKSTNS